MFVPHLQDRLDWEMRVRVGLHFERDGFIQISPLVPTAVHNTYDAKPRLEGGGLVALMGVLLVGDREWLTDALMRDGHGEKPDREGNGLTGLVLGRGHDDCVSARLPEVFAVLLTKPPPVILGEFMTVGEPVRELGVVWEPPLGDIDNVLEIVHCRQTNRQSFIGPVKPHFRQMGFNRVSFFLLSSSEKLEFLLFMNMNAKSEANVSRRQSATLLHGSCEKRTATSINTAHCADCVGPRRSSYREQD